MFPVETHFQDQSHPGASRRSPLFVCCCGAAYPARLFGKNEETPCPARSAKSANPPASALSKAKRSAPSAVAPSAKRSEEHTSELQSHSDLVCRLLLEKKKKKTRGTKITTTRKLYK